LSGVVLVLTTVHPADDPRIRHRTVGVLAQSMPVRYATRDPAPDDTTGFQWVGLPGSRLARGLRGLREALRRDVGVVSVHDPELVPVALVARAAGRRVVVDDHEDVPAQIRHKEWLPRPLRVVLAPAAGLALRMAERTCVITLAEANYAHLFSGTHPVLPNYPLAEGLPAPRDVTTRDVVYVGDVTAARGAELAVRAVAAMSRPRPLVMIGRCREPFRSELGALAQELDIELHLPGFMVHAAAMERVATASVGISPLLGLPNHRESLPSKVIEYLALGVPAVASDLPGTRRVIEDLPGMQLVAAGDVEAWTRALESATTDAGWRMSAQEGAPHVRARYTWPSAELRALYSALLCD
jgi:glycosyltransferase involved in cell wall biosynthesis